MTHLRLGGALRALLQVPRIAALDAQDGAPFVPMPSYVISVLFMAALMAVLACAGCAPTTRVVMLPQPGHRSIVEIEPRAGAARNWAAPNARITLLTMPYQIATAETKGPVSVKQWNQVGVNSRYEALLAAQPPPPHNYLLYFEFNGTRLAPQSAAELDGVITQALARPGNEIVVTGYTDSVGTMAANDKLSLQRAQVIRAAIIAHGFNPARIYAVGRGSRDPLVPVRVQEQRNRRVEITVR